MLKLKMQAERDIPCERETKQQSERETKSERETENESESETEREIESMWESLIARSSKLERVEREIERVSDERVAVGMKFISWVSVCIERGSFDIVIKLRECVVPESIKLGYHSVLAGQFFRS